MRTHPVTTWLVALTSVSLLGGGLLVAAPAAADPVHQLQSLTVSSAAVAPAGFTTVDVTITAVVRADDGISPCADEIGAFGGGLVAGLTHEGPAPRGVLTGQDVTLALVAGTRTLGTWSATWKVASPWSGTWTVTRILGCVSGGVMAGDQPMFDVRPPDVGLARTVTVTGTKAPTMTMTRTPTIAPYGKNQLIRFTYRNGNGTPLAGRRIAVGWDTECGFYGWGAITATLDTKGSYAVNRSAANTAGKGDRCPMLTTPQGLVDPNVTGAVMLYERTSNAWWFKTVTYALSTTSVRLGRSATVSGVVSPVDGAGVVLQRYQNRRWRSAGYAPVRASGRYTLYAAPPTRGTWTYRVLAMPGTYARELVPTPTRTFTVRAF